MTQLDNVFGDSFDRGSEGARAAARMRLKIVPLNRIRFSEYEWEEVAGAFGVGAGMGTTGIGECVGEDLGETSAPSAAPGASLGTKYVLHYQAGSGSPGRNDADLNGPLLSRAIARSAYARARELVGSVGLGSRDCAGDGWLALAMADGATEIDILEGILHAEYFRKMSEQADEASGASDRPPLDGSPESRRRFEMMRASRKKAVASRDAFVASLREGGYQIRPFLLSAGERSRWRVRECADDLDYDLDLDGGR